MKTQLSRRTIVSLSFASLACTITSPAFAEGGQGGQGNKDRLQTALFLTEEIESNLNANGTSIAEQLRILSADLEEDIDDNPPNTVQEITENDILRNAVRAIAASFVALDFKLSGELVIYSLKRTGGTYSPNFGSRAKSSPVISAIKRGRSTSGSAAFTKKSGGNYAADLYYAIHRFSYSKMSPSGSTVRIGDVYDFAPEKYEGIQGKAVATMELAQRRGVIKPFRVAITI